MSPSQLIIMVSLVLDKHNEFFFKSVFQRADNKVKTILQEFLNWNHQTKKLNHVFSIQHILSKRSIRLKSLISKQIPQLWAV